MLRNLKLGTKFNLLLLLVFICGISLSGFALSQVMQQRAQDEVTSKALILMQAMNSVRNYTSDHIIPLLADKLESEPTFVAETVPAFSATEVFEDLRQNPAYRNFFYKEAAPNPTNLRDKADGFETDLVARFSSEPKTKEISGFRNVAGGQIFYIARPLAIPKQSCLVCHSTPDQAPKSLIRTYGSENGFGWQLNEIIATQVISVPAGDIFDAAHRSSSLVMSVLLGVFAAVILLINLLLRKVVIRRIRKMANMAQEVSTGTMIADFEQDSNDEIGSLGAAFNRMKSSLEIAMRLLSHQGS